MCSVPLLISHLSDVTLQEAMKSLRNSQNTLYLSQPGLPHSPPLHAICDRSSFEVTTSFLRVTTLIKGAKSVTADCELSPFGCGSEAAGADVVVHFLVQALVSIVYPNLI